MTKEVLTQDELNNLIDTISSDIPSKEQQLDPMVEMMFNILGNAEKLFCAIENNDIDAVADLISNRDYVNFVGPESFTPLMVAINYRHKDIASLLIKEGAYVNYETPSGLTPLFYAMSIDDKEMVALLIENGADVDFVNRYGKTASDYTNNNNIRLVR